MRKVLIGIVGSFGAKTLTMVKMDVKVLSRSTQTWIRRRMETSSQKEEVTNEELLKRVIMKRMPLETIGRSQH